MSKKKIIGASAGSKLKATNAWDRNGNGTNESGFTALPGGFRCDDGSFSSIGIGGYWWSSTGDDDHAVSFLMTYFNGKLGRFRQFNGKGFSVRLIRHI